MKVPDLAHAKVSGPALKGGAVTADFSRGELRVACKRWDKLQLPTVRVQFAMRSFESPLCAQPPMGPLVGHP